MDYLMDCLLLDPKRIALMMDRINEHQGFDWMRNVS